MTGVDTIQLWWVLGLLLASMMLRHPLLYLTIFVACMGVVYANAATMTTWNLVSFLTVATWQLFRIWEEA